MRILIFTEGTVIMHSAGAGLSREEIVQQVSAAHPSLYEWASCIPIGHAAAKLRRWHEQGATISYLTSRTTPEDLAQIVAVLARHGFPEGPLLHRAPGEQYHLVAERAHPDLLIEDDCASIGGDEEMTITHVSPDLRANIKSIRLREFEGIDHLPDSLEELVGNM